MNLVGPFIALFLTFAVLSFVWRDNPLYRTVESLFIGVAMGLFATFEIRQVLIPRLWDRLVAGPSTALAWVSAIVVILVSLILVARAIPSLHWLGRVPIAIAVGSLAGMVAAGFFRSVLIPQVGASATTLTFTDTLSHARSMCLLESAPPNALTNVVCSFGPYVNQLVIGLGVVAALMHFIFSRKENAGFRAVSRIGSIVVMITLGVTLAFVVMTHFAVTIDRAQTMIEAPELAFLALGIVVLTLAVLRGLREPSRR